MKFKIWLETQIPFMDYPTFIKRVNNLINNTKQVPGAREPIDEISYILRSLSGASRESSHTFMGDLGRFLGRLRNALRVAGFSDLADEADDLIVQTTHREYLTPRDRFRMIATGTNDLGTNRFQYGFTPGDQQQQPWADGFPSTKDERNKWELVKLYRQVHKAVEHFRDAHGLLGELDHDIYNPQTWDIVMDRVEDEGVDTTQMRQTLKNIFSTMPKKGGFRHDLGWED